MALDERTEQLIQDGLHDLLQLQLVREVLVAAPAAGAQWSQVVPGGSIWELISIDGVLTTSAVVGSRGVTLRVNDADGNHVLRLPVGPGIAASQTREICWVAGLGYADANVANQAGLPTPPPIVLAGWSIASLVANMDVGDQWSSIVMVVRIHSVTSIVQNAQLIGRDLQALTIDK